MLLQLPVLGPVVLGDELGGGIEQVGQARQATAVVADLRVRRGTLAEVVETDLQATQRLIDCHHRVTLAARPPSQVKASSRRGTP